MLSIPLNSHLDALKHQVGEDHGIDGNVFQWFPPFLPKYGIFLILRSKMLSFPLNNHLDALKHQVGEDHGIDGNMFQWFPPFLPKYGISSFTAADP